ncbi:MAG TPA: DMT family transporter [Elusimicrobiales bacterium]|nr:DMT family transporter [Elusimicrobiales bacterium]
MKKISILGLVYCSLIWGSTFFVVKDALAGVHPVSMVAFRFLLAALLILPVVLVKKIAHCHIKEGFVLACFLTIGYVSQTWGLQYTTASNSGFITALSVLFVPIILFFFFARSVSKKQWISCFVASIGLWFLTGGVSGFNFGDMLTLVCAPGFALQIIYIAKYVKNNSNLLSLAFHQFWITGILCLIISFVFGYSLAVTSVKVGWMIVFLAVFPTLSAFFIQLWSQKRVEPVKVGLILALEPLFAAVFAWTLGAEAIKFKTVIGGSIIIIAMLISELSTFGRLKVEPPELAKVTHIP